MLLVFTTCPDSTEAESLAKGLLDSRLAACVQILPKMTSMYFWEGEIQRGSEHLLIVKSLPEKWDQIEHFIQEQHSYSVPEIVAIEADRVSKAYSEWARSAME